MLSLLFVGFAFSEEGNISEGIIKITVSNGNIRSKPDVQSKKLGLAKKETLFLVHKKEGDWFQIFMPDGNKGWVYKSIVRIEDSLSSKFTPVPIEVQDAIPLFKMPNFFSKHLIELEVGAVLKFREINKGWFRVSSGELTGWIPTRKTINNLTSPYRDSSSIREMVFLKILRMLEHYNQKKAHHPKFLKAKWYPAFTTLKKRNNVKATFVDAFYASVTIELYVQKISTESFFPLKEETFIFFPNADKIFLTTMIKKLLDEGFFSFVSIRLHLLKPYTEGGRSSIL